MHNKPILTPSPRDAALFLRIAGQGAAVSSHSELVQWLQGDVQRWLPHAAMVVGSGELRGGQLQCEVFSGPALLRSLAATPGCLGRLLGYLRDCWVAAQHAPCRVDLAECEPLLRDCSAAQRQALGGMHTAIVHGTTSRATGMQTVFAALTTEPNPPAGAGTALKLVLPFMDSALGRISASVPAPVQAEEHGTPTNALRLLSERERQIMQWVALGKTNPEIGCILSISEFTVKNHMKSIFSKLDVANRAQAVAQLTRPNAHA